MDRLAVHNALNARLVSQTELDITECTQWGWLRVQVFSRTAEWQSALGAALGIEVPGPGEILIEPDMQWFWSAPGEWVVCVADGIERSLADDLSAKLEGLVAAVSVMTDSRVVLELRGSRLNDVLARGSTVDFHPSRFTEGRCINTRFATIPVMLAKPFGGERVLLFADRSFAHYLLDWLGVASAQA